MAGVNTITLDQSNFAEVIGSQEKMTLVDFWASWCMPCKAVAPIVDKLAEEYSDKIVVGKVNVDEQQAIAVQYEIMSIPTLILFKGGQVLETVVGVRRFQDYQSVLQKHL